MEFNAHTALVIAEQYHPEMGDEDDLESFEEHGSIFVVNVATGDAWSAHECTGIEAISFEQL